MTLKKFYLGRVTGCIALITILVAAFAYKEYFLAPDTAPAVGENTQAPVFVWSYEKAASLNPDGVPETNIFLQATYPNGTMEKKFIATTHSSCNELPESEKDSVPGSTTIQCYGAGLGYRFKIIASESLYQILKKKFEEASPEYTPPLYNYEVVAEFSKQAS